MKTTAEMNAHFQGLTEGRAVYVWGGNCETITREWMDRLYRTYGSSRYNRAYYDEKFAEGQGRAGADCSGAFRPVSGYDTTADGYYHKCTEKGEIGSLPKATPCMVFIKQNGKMVHIGWYDGTGSVYEMRSSKMNVRHDALSARWTHWGKPEFVQYTEAEQGAGEEKIMIELAELRKGNKGAQVKTVQRILKALGYSVGGTGVDGDFGKNTEKAVKAFQADRGITADGIVGKNTWTKLLK